MVLIDMEMPKRCGECFNIYISRYKQRGNTEEFIQKISSNWNSWITEIINEPSVLKAVVVLPLDGCIQAWAKEISGGVNDEGTKCSVATDCRTAWRKWLNQDGGNNS